MESGIKILTKKNLSFSQNLHAKKYSLIASNLILMLMRNLQKKISNKKLFLVQCNSRAIICFN